VLRRNTSHWCFLQCW